MGTKCAIVDCGFSIHSPSNLMHLQHFPDQSVKVAQPTSVNCASVSLNYDDLQKMAFQISKEISNSQLLGTVIKLCKSAVTNSLLNNDKLVLWSNCHATAAHHESSSRE